MGTEGDRPAPAPAPPPPDGTASLSTRRAASLKFRAGRAEILVTRDGQLHGAHRPAHGGHRGACADVSFIDMTRCSSSRAPDGVTPKARTPPATASACRRASPVLLLARSPDGRADAPLGVVRHEVAVGHASATRRSTTWSRSRCRASATSRCRARASRCTTPDSRPGSRSSIRSCTSCITSIRTARHPPHGARRRHVLGELPRPAVLRGRRRDGEAVSGTKPDPIRRTTFWRTTSRSSPSDTAVWRVPRSELPVVSAAVHRGARSAAAGSRPRDCRVEPLKVTRVGTTFTEGDLTIARIPAAHVTLLVRERPSARHDLDRGASCQVSALRASIETPGRCVWRRASGRPSTRLRIASRPARRRASSARGRTRRRRARCRRGTRR